MENAFDTKGKSWQKPELIVLVRNKPDENVLVACKATMSSPPNRARKNDCATAGCNANGTS